MERWTIPKLSLGCIFFCFLWNVSLLAILLFFLPTFLWSHPKLHLHPELTVDWAFPCPINPPFSTPISTQRRAPCISYEDREIFLKAISPSPLGAACPAVFPCCAPPRLFASLLTLGGLQGIAAFPLISRTSKRYQHHFCCRLCLCDRLWTIWMSLHLAAIKAPRCRAPHLRLSAPHRAELASPQRPVLPHKHQTTSQNPISTSPEHLAAEEMLLSNLRVGVCSVIESLPNKLQQLTWIILKEQTQTVFGVMYQRKVTDRRKNA